MPGSLFFICSGTDAGISVSVVSLRLKGELKWLSLTAELLRQIQRISIHRYLSSSNILEYILKSLIEFGSYT